MAGNYLAILMAATLGQFPIPFGGQYQAPPQGAYQGPSQGAYQGPPQGAYQGPPQGGGPGTSQYGPGAILAAPDSTQALNTGDPFYPFDYEPNWTHGYIQEIPAYGGYHFFRPYNYKHVMPQSQVSAAWGNSANMPYSHQYFDKVSGHQTVWNAPGPRSSVARTHEELKEQLAGVDRTRVAPKKGTGSRQQIAQQQTGRNVTPAGHREN